MLEKSPSDLRADDAAARAGIDHDHSHARLKLRFAMLGAILIINSMIASWIFDGPGEGPHISTFSAFLGALILAYPIWIAAVRHIWNGKIQMNELVALALLACFVKGMFLESGIIAFFMMLAITIEERTAIGAKTAIEELIKLTPSRARLIDPASGAETDVAAGRLAVGNVVRIRPGESFPADGKVIKGTSAVNQASITGESLPVDKVENDDVYAGTNNLTGLVDIRVTGIGEETTLGKVKSMIEEAERTRLPIMRLVDRYVVYYTPVILMITALVGLLTEDLILMVLVLVISCPCAVIVATPSAAIAALASAARLGMLIKDVSHIEVAANVRTVVFDKTGTLTTGELEVARLKPAPGVELDELLTTAVAAEAQSNHPAANAMERLAKDANISWEQPKHFTEITGQGVIAEFDDGEYRVGRESWLRESKHDVAEIAALVAEDKEFEAMSLVYVAKGKRVLGCIGLRDGIRPAAAAAIKELDELGISHCCMVTGDNSSVATAVAAEVGIADFQAECLASDKVDYVNRIGAEEGAVAFVGDGVNDAPALVTSDVGIAMGAIGSDVAINSASIALMNNDLRRIPFLIALSRKTVTVMHQNLIFGAMVVVGGMIFFIFGHHLLDRVASIVKIEASVLKAFVAAIIHILSTLLVVFNSARLVRFGEYLLPLGDETAAAVPAAAAGHDADTAAGSASEALASAETS